MQNASTHTSVGPAVGALTPAYVSLCDPGVVMKLIYFSRNLSKSKSPSFSAMLRSCSRTSCASSVPSPAWADTTQWLGHKCDRRDSPFERRVA